ncbi:major facilitator superfamily domain-containing protein [Penicillium hordei]|uniref:Major facilitator superfamily domain-containing protein n=1 Tax=Penicillium hordei TaxID=40994 RepID=A0AAD6DTN7_9EURO|nr:major facilitator superfamily domain-containing protein [Penicillium hordei]KAJ5592645.1 major facilitator superfamily domain-containing protein [Penicillium hordei]
MTISLATGLLAFVFLYEESKCFSAPTEGVELETNKETRTTECSQKSHDTKKNPEIESHKQPAEMTTLDKLPPLYDVDIDESIPSTSYKQRLLQFTVSRGSISQLLLHTSQPFHVMLCIPGILYMAIIYGMSWAVMTIIGTNMATFMPAPPYNFSASGVGLMTLPVFVGTGIGVEIVGPTSDRLILYLAKRKNGIYEPEMRLWLLVAFIPLVPTGLMVAGCGFQYSLPWPIVAVGFGAASLGITPAISVSLTYVIDAYTEANPGRCYDGHYIRSQYSLNGDTFFLLPWINRMGLLNVHIVVSVISTVIFMITFTFIYYGKRIRTATATRYRWFSSRQFSDRI